MKIRVKGVNCRVCGVGKISGSFFLKRIMRKVLSVSEKGYMPLLFLLNISRLEKLEVRYQIVEKLFISEMDGPISQSACYYCVAFDS